MNLNTLNTQPLKENNFFYICKKYICFLLCSFCFFTALHSQKNTTGIYLASNAKVVGLKNIFTKAYQPNSIKVFIKDNTSFSYCLNQLTNAQLIVVEVKRKFQTKISKQIIVAKAKTKQKHTTNHVFFSSLDGNSHWYKIRHCRNLMVPVYRTGSKNSTRKKYFPAVSKFNTNSLNSLKTTIRKQLNTQKFYSTGSALPYCLANLYSRPPPNHTKYAITAIA